eukprot:scaffold175132_cov65-Attheya_sp.AAC.3
MWTCAGFWQSIGVATTMLQRRFYYSAVTIDVMGGDGFVDIFLVEAPSLKRGVCVWGLREREREEWWEAGQNCLLGRYEASGGVWRSRLAKEGGLLNVRRITRLDYIEGVREVELVVI